MPIYNLRKLMFQFSPDIHFSNGNLLFQFEILICGDSFVQSMGKEWAAYASPYKDYLKQGVHISGGADAPVTPFPPLWGIYGAVTRRAQLSKEILGPDQRLAIQEALRTFTMGGAWMTFERE